MQAQLIPTAAYHLAREAFRACQDARAEDPNPLNVAVVALWRDIFTEASDLNRAAERLESDTENELAELDANEPTLKMSWPHKQWAQHRGDKAATLEAIQKARAYEVDETTPMSVIPLYNDIINRFCAQHQPALAAAFELVRKPFTVINVSEA